MILKHFFQGGPPAFRTVKASLMEGGVAEICLSWSHSRGTSEGKSHSQNLPFTAQLPSPLGGAQRPKKIGKGLKLWLGETLGWLTTLTWEGINGLLDACGLMQEYRDTPKMPMD